MSLPKTDPTVQLTIAVAKENAYHALAQQLDQVLAGVDTEVLVRYVQNFRDLDIIGDAESYKLQDELEKRQYCVLQPGELDPDHEDLLEAVEALAVSLRLRRPTAQILAQAEAVCELGGFNALPGPHAERASFQQCLLEA